jgi:hypothetical protein
LILPSDTGEDRDLPPDLLRGKGLKLFEDSNFLNAVRWSGSLLDRQAVVAL